MSDDEEIPVSAADATLSLLADVMRAGETKIFNMKNDKFEAVKAYKPSGTISYTCVHTPDNPFFDVRDSDKSPSEGSGLTLRLTLDTANSKSSWECKTLSKGSGYAETDVIKVYGNITGLNVLLAYGIGASTEATIDKYLKGTETLKMLQTLDSHWGGEYSTIKVGKGGACRVGIEGNSTLIDLISDSKDTNVDMYAKSGFYHYFDEDEISSTQLKQFFNRERSRGWVGVGSGIGVLSRVLGTREARRFREKAKRDYDKHIAGPLDELLQAIKVKSVGHLGGIGNAGRKGGYLQDPSFFDDVKFKRFAGAVSDAASFAAHVRPLISDEHVAAVSAHLAQLPSGSIVRPKYIKDFIRKL